MLIDKKIIVTLHVLIENERIFAHDVLCKAKRPVSQVEKVKTEGVVCYVERKNREK